MLLPVTATNPTTGTTTTTALGSIDNTPLPEEKEDSETDDELVRITEANRCIKSEPRSSVTSQTTLRRDLLVFAETPSVLTKSDRVIVHNKYGAGLSGDLDPALMKKTQKRSYLVACDFSEESIHAIEWTMGTMMRDGDGLYVVTVINKDEAVDSSKKSMMRELQKASDNVTEESKRLMNQMLLFDIDLITYTICGRVKEALTKLIWELPITMIVCGSRGRSTVKGLLMGSISTYLVHNSPVPVTVIRPEKKKRISVVKPPVHAIPLSQSVETKQLAVDELSHSHPPW
ncbi:hypothetical protein BDB01DRAFT_727197 [Pilobolus umbonatus]|nr:hypothetical protein BDB01DRAFT_727197 [Pilobolus umbonatus]